MFSSLSGMSVLLPDGLPARICCPSFCWDGHRFSHHLSHVLKPLCLLKAHLFLWSILKLPPQSLHGLLSALPWCPHPGSCDDQWAWGLDTQPPPPAQGASEGLPPSGLSLGLAGPQTTSPVVPRAPLSKHPAYSSLRQTLHGGAHPDPHRECKEGLVLLKLFICIMGFASVDSYVPESMGMLIHLEQV